jgi:hypothetical protein
VFSHITCTVDASLRQASGSLPPNQHAGQGN